MIRRRSLLALPLAGALAVPAAAAPAAAHGSFEMEQSYWGDESISCTETTAGGTAGCGFGGLSIAPDYKVGTRVGDGCIGLFTATLHVDSPTAGRLSIPGTIELTLASGRFAGRLVSGTTVVTAEASYSGPHCSPFIVPIGTHISGTYDVVAAG